MPVRRTEAPAHPCKEDAHKDLSTLEEFVNSRAVRRKRTRSATRQQSVDDALQTAMHIIRLREADILRAVEYGQGLLAELADLKQSNDQREPKLRHESAYANRRRDFQVREYQETIKALEERLTSKDADLKHKETTLARMTQQLSTVRRELEESLAEVKLLRIENIGLQQIVSRQSKQRHPPHDGGTEGPGTAVEAKRGQVPVADAQKELTRMYEQQLAQLRQQLQETEGLLEEERLRVATLQADQALKAYWATSGSMAALKTRIEELENQNAMLVDSGARAGDKVQSALQDRLQALQSDIRALEAEARGMQQAYAQGLQCASEAINALVARLGTQDSLCHDAEVEKLLASAASLWETFRNRFISSPNNNSSSRQQSATREDRGHPHGVRTCLEGPDAGCNSQAGEEASALQGHLRRVTAQLITCQRALDEERQRASHSGHLLRRAILAEETSASELGRCVELMRRTQEMMAGLRRERDDALRCRDQALMRCRAGQQRMQQQLDTAVQDRDVACRLALQYEQKLHAAQQNASGRLAPSPPPSGLSWLPRIGTAEFPAGPHHSNHSTPPSPTPREHWRAGLRALDLGIPHLGTVLQAQKAADGEETSVGCPTRLQTPATQATEASAPTSDMRMAELQRPLAVGGSDTVTAHTALHKPSTPTDISRRSVMGSRTTALGDLTNTRSTLAWVHGKLKR